MFGTQEHSPVKLGFVHPLPMLCATMLFLAEPTIAPVLVVCVCPLFIKVGQMIEEGLCITLCKGC